MSNPTIQPKEPTSNVAIPIMIARAKSGVIRCTIPTLYPMLQLSK